MTRRAALVLAAVAVALVLATAAAASMTDLAPRASPGQPRTSFASHALSATEAFAIALPPGYAGSRRRYPVIYALHGLPAGASTYRSVPIARMAATAAAAGRPAIVVAPQGARAGATDDEWHDWEPGRRWETAVAAELVAYVDRNWRTIPDRRSRAIIGTSAGGYGAMIIGLHRPETYSVIESWSGYFHPTTPKGDATLHVGSEADDRAADAHNFVGCLAALQPRYRPRFLGFYVGGQDHYQDFIDDNRRLHAELVAAAVPHRFAVYDGGHARAFWAAHERSWLLDGVARLDAAPPRARTNGSAIRAAAQRAGCPRV